MPTIGSVEEINALSGYLQPQIITLNNQTGSYTLKSETGQFYAASNPSGYITGINNLVYATGNQNISGNLNIFGNIVTSGHLISSGTSNRLPNQIVNTSDSILTRQLADDRYYINDNASSIIGISMFI